jgi:hypothetical protein
MFFSRLLFQPKVMPASKGRSVNTLSSQRGFHPLDLVHLRFSAGQQRGTRRTGGCQSAGKLEKATSRKHVPGHVDILIDRIAWPAL